MNKEVIKIANCSGYYGDKLSAAKDMVDGGPIDVLTGDYLAELTMAILYGQRMQRGEDNGVDIINDISGFVDVQNISFISKKKNTNHYYAYAK